MTGGADTLIGSDNAKHDSLSGEYEKHYRIKAGDVVVDIGAHVGYFAEHACDAGAFVIAFEPHPMNFSLLSERLRGKSAIAINGAASHSDGIRTLHECPTNSGAHSLFKHGQCSDVEHTVGCLNVGRFLARIAGRVDFIKIDTEGEEMQILFSLFRNGIRASMAIETHDSSLYERCKKLAEAHGMEWLPKVNHVGVCYCLPK